MEKDPNKHRKKLTNIPSPRELKIKNRKGDISVSCTQPTTPNGCSSKYSSVSEEKFDSPRLSDGAFNSKTFRGIPNLLDNSLKFLKNTLIQSTKYRVPIDKWTNEDICSLPFIHRNPFLNKLITEGTIQPQALFKYSYHDLLNLKFSIFDAQKILHFISQLRLIPSIFKHINSSQCFNNSDFKQVFNLLQKYRSGNAINLYVEANPFIVLLLLKYYFLSLSQPFFCDKLIIDLMTLMDPIVVSETSHGGHHSFSSENAKSSSEITTPLDISISGQPPNKKEKIEKEVKMILKQYLDNDEQAIFHKFVELVIDVKEVFGDEEGRYCASFFLDCFSPEYSFGEQFDSMLPTLYSKNKTDQIFLFDSEDAYDGEITKCIFDNVRCPLSIITEPLSSLEVAIPGKLAVTTYRIIFIPSVNLDVQRKAILGRISQCPLTNIIDKKWVEIVGHSTEYAMRITTSSYGVLTFFSYDNIFKAIEKTIDEIMSEGVSSVFINTDLSVPINIENDWENRIKRYHWEELKKNQNSDKLPFNAPLIQNNIKCLERNRDVYVCYTLENAGSHLCRLTTPTLRNIKTEIIVDSSQEDKIRIIEVSIGDIETVEKTFNEILSNVVNNKESIGYKIFMEKIGKVNTFVTRFIGTCEDIISSLSRSKSVLLIPKNFRETEIGIFSGFVQLLLDPYFRTIRGFIEMIHCEFTSSKYDFEAQRNSFTFFIVSLFLLYKTYPMEFEFNEMFIHYIFLHSTSRVFSDFNQSDVSSLQTYIDSHSSDFLNTYFEPKLDSIPVRTIVVHFCNEVFYQVQTYNPQTVAKLLQTCRTGDLDLGQMNLFFFPIHPSFPILSGITKLNLSNNHLGDFPTEIAKLTGLIEFNISNNKLIVINDMLSKLTNLTLLNVSNNNLSYIPKCITTLRIIDLDLSNNDLQKPNSLNLPSSVKRLSLRSNFFFPSISTLQLTYLDISETVGLEQAEFASLLPKSLVDLSLSKCFIEHLPIPICKLSNLERLDLSQNGIMSFHPSFFVMTNLKELDLKKNPIPQLSFLFSRLVSLTKLQIDDIVSIPIVMKKMFPEKPVKDKLTKKVNEEDIQVYLTGDVSKNEVYPALAKKTGKEIDTRSFLLDKNVVVSDIACEIIEENPFVLLKNSVFVICKRVMKAKSNIAPFSRLLSFFSFIRLHQPIICVSVRVNEETLLKIDETIEENLHQTYPDLKISFIYFDINGKEKQIKDLVKVIKNASEECKINISPFTSKVIDELQYIDIMPGILEMDYLKMLMESLCMKEDQFPNIIETLQKLQYVFLYPETYSTTLSNYTMHFLNSRPHRNHFVLLSLQLPELIYQLLSKNETSTGIQLPEFFLNPEIHQLTPEQQDYILILLEYFQIIFVLRKPFFERMGLADEFEQLNKHVSNPNILIKQPQQTIQKSITETILTQSARLPLNGPITTIPVKKSSSFRKHSRSPRLQLPVEGIMGSSPSNSPFSRSPRASRIESGEKRQNLPKVMILNYYGMSPLVEEGIWENCKKNEIEIGRCYRFNCLPLQFCMMLHSVLSVKYVVIRGWRGGILCNILSSESKYQLLAEWDLDKLRVSFRLKILVESANSFLRTKEIWEGISNVVSVTMKYFPQITTTCDILCPHCLTKCSNVDNCYCISLNEIEETLQCGLYSDVFGHHCISFALNCWDVMVKRLELKKKAILKEEIEFVSTIAHGSSSQINLCKVKGFNENVVVKEMEIDLKGLLMNGDDYVSYYIDRVEDFLRECEFLTFPESPYVAKIYSYCLKPLSIIMEYFNGGSLFQYIAKSKDIPWKERIQIAICIAKGMSLFTGQKCPVVHRDLKSPNVILKINGENQITQVAITDFGQSIPTFAENFKSCHSVECPYWLAPEVIETSTFELESDVYSYGMILWELSTLSTPFPKFNFMEEVRTFIKNGNLLEIPPSPYPDFDAIIADCWKVAKARPSFAAIVIKLTKILKQM